MLSSRTNWGEPAPERWPAPLPKQTGRRVWRHGHTTLFSGLILFITLALSASWAQRSGSPASIQLPPNVTLADVNSPVFDITPDGSRVVFVGRSGGVTQLYLQRIGDRAAPLAGTEGADTPFFSPDGKWIGFFASGKLKKISADQGTVVDLCDAPQARGASWGDGDIIVFTPTLTTGLWQISGSGGTPKTLTELNKERGHRWPQVLPGGKQVLFT